MRAVRDDCTWQSLSAESAISAAERMDIGPGPDKCVPVVWLVLIAASV